MANLSTMVSVVRAAQATQARSANMTNEYRKDKAYHSQIGRSIRRHSTGDSLDTKAAWHFETEQTATRLAFLIIVYLFANDDDKISRSEKSSIEKLIANKGNYLEAKDYEDIYSFIQEKPSLKYVIEYINNSTISLDIFDNSIKILRPVIKNKKKYLDLLRDLIKQAKLYL